MKEGRNRLISHKTYRLLSYLQSHSVWRAVSTVREQRTGGSVSTSQLETLLYTHTASEQWHLENPDAVSPRYESVPKILVEDEKVMLFNWENTLQERAVGMIKETRFTSIPPHINHDMELNFIYEGSCDFVVNGRRFTLREGDVLICDADVVRSSPSVKGEHDIVISIIFRKEFFDSVFLSRLPGSGMLTSLLFDVVARNRAHNRSLILPSAYAGRTRSYIELMFEEYHFAGLYNNELMSSLTTSLFLELMRGLHRYTRHSDGKSFSDGSMSHILSHIEKNYKDCSLSSVAEAFGYNSNYLGNLIKERTGRSFSEIKCEQQMSEAAYLLANTDRPITSIAAKVGIGNMTYFYRKFEAAYGCTPKQYRRMAPTK